MTASTTDGFSAVCSKASIPLTCWHGLGPHMPPGWQDDFETIAAPVDWLGVNYYTRKLIADDGTGVLACIEGRSGAAGKNIG